MSEQSSSTASTSPGCDTLEVYQRRGGYESLRKAMALQPQQITDELLGVERARPRRRRLRDGPKVSFMPAGDMDKYLVCNADESEPGTFKDRELITKTPHTLIEGMIIAAFAAGATRSFIYIRGEYQQQADILDAALAEAYDAGYLGQNILGSGFDLSLVVHRGAGAYICGEETALLDSLEGKRGNPRLKPPFPANQGLFQGPTLINNVETLHDRPAHPARWAARSTRSIGVENSTGTKLVSVSGHVRRPGNYEIVLGTRSREIIYDLAGGPDEGREIKLWFPGGSSSPVLTRDDLDLPYDFDSMAKAGSMLGSGAIIVVDDSVSVVDVAYKTAAFYAHESCGKCSPCREGTRWTVKMLERIKAGLATPMDLDIMASVQTRIIGNCLCVLGDAMAMPIGSMVAKFRDEFEEYIEAAPHAQPVRRRARPTSSPPWPRARPPSAPCRAPSPSRSRSRIDGREVQAPVNTMLVDAAKLGDVEIPVFCYEPKLGAPVGACRMCLVEVEGIPKLQTGCSTPVKDGMVVHTQTARVKEAQEAVVEFLLDQPPARLPGLRQGRRVPAAGHLVRLGRRPLALHRAQAPLPEAARPVAAHRDRPRALHPLLPLRALQPGDLRGLPARPPGARSRHVRRDLRRAPLRRAVQRQHHRALPGRRADVAALPLPRAPVGHRGRGLGLRPVPRPVQRRADRPRRARPARPVPRERRGRRRLALRPGALRLPVDPRRRAHHPAARCATAGSSRR